MDFCRLHTISTGNFHKWKSRRTGSYKNAGFATVDVMDSPTLLPGLFAEGKGIRIYRTVSASF
jgi:hypothetical protein